MAGFALLNLLTVGFPEMHEKCLEVPVSIKFTETLLRQTKAAAAHDDLSFGAYVKGLIIADLDSKRARKEALESIFVDSPA